GSALCPTRMAKAEPRYPGTDEGDATLRRDSGLPEERVQAAGEPGARLDRRAREGPVGLARVRVRDGEEADGARSARAREIPRRAPESFGRGGRTRGNQAPPPARAVPGGDPGPARRRRPRRG